jgi:hypothetical protein
MEEDLEEITKDWSVDILIPIGPTDMFDPELDILDTTQK